MNGYWLGFRKNCRCYGCPENYNNRSVHFAPQDNLGNRNQKAPYNAYTGNKPAQSSRISQTDDAVTRQIEVKTTSLGSVSVPANTAVGSIYHIASLNIQTLCFDRFHIRLCFSCNLNTTNAKINLGFQIFKQGICQSKPVPVSCNFDFCRNKESSESNIFSFIACDYDSFKDKCCNYSVYAKVTGMATSGVTSISNSILSAALIEIPENC